MAIDEALLGAVGNGSAPPTLRFYEWRSPWVSLGSAQVASEIDQSELAARRWGLVRRGSGGTAVLHWQHLGYALILPTDNPLLSGDLVASYLRLSEPLRLAFERLGVSATAAPPSTKVDFARDAPALGSRVCFGALGPYEIVVRGRKVVGNSQIRRRFGATQHGVIQVDGGQDPLADVIASPTEHDREDLRDYLASHVDSLAANAGRAMDVSELVHALTEAFGDELGIRFEPGELTPSERQEATELVETKFGNPSWTFRR